MKQITQQEIKSDYERYFNKEIMNRISCYLKQQGFNSFKDFIEWVEMYKNISIPFEIEKLFFRFPYEIIVRLKEYKGRQIIKTFTNNETTYIYDENNKYVKDGRYTYKT